MRSHYAVDAAADAAYDFRRADAPPASRYRAVKFATRAILNHEFQHAGEFRTGALATARQFRRIPVDISNVAARQNYDACNQLLHTAPVMSTLPLGGINIMQYTSCGTARARARRTVTSIIEEFPLQELRFVQERGTRMS